MSRRAFVIEGDPVRRVVVDPGGDVFVEQRGSDAMGDPVWCDADGSPNILAAALVLAAFPEQPAEVEQPTEPRQSNQQRVAAVLTDSRQHVEQLAAACGLTSRQVVDAAKRLVRQGEAARPARGYYIVSKAEPAQQTIVADGPPASVRAYCDEEQGRYWQERYRHWSRASGVEDGAAARTAWADVRYRWPETRKPLSERGA